MTVIILGVGTHVDKIGLELCIDPVHNHSISFVFYRCCLCNV